MAEASCRVLMLCEMDTVATVQPASAGRGLILGEQITLKG